MSDETNKLFRHWIEQGWRFRMRHNPRMKTHVAEYRSRLKREISVIEEKDFIHYFLMVSDLVRYAKDSDIAVGPGRGSSAASLVCYLLRITEIDPLCYPMLFERFMDPTRTDEPDIDIDFEDIRRNEVMEYAASKYGQDHVANIINFVRYRSKNSLDDVARVYRVPHWITEQIKSKLLDRSEGHPRALKVLEDTADTFEEVAELFRSKPELKYAMNLEGNYRGLNVHAAGMVICAEPLNNITATYQRETSGGDVRWGIAYDKRDATYLGLLKIDALSLQTMGMISEVCKWSMSIYGEGQGISLKELYRIPLDDKEVLSAFAKGDVLGIFQFEGNTTRRILKKVVPEHFMHLADVNALSRPGADDKAYVSNKLAGEELSIDYPHSVLKQHLSWTYGTVVYEEQILMVLRDLGGFQPAELNKLRKVIHDKLGSTAFNEYYARFLEGCAAQGVSEDTASSIWQGMVSASGYAFNIAHSVSYAHIGYWQMYLKIHYPAAFYAGLLLKCSDDQRRTRLIQEAERKGIKVMPPSLTVSQDNWSVSQNDEGYVITAGFSSIDGIGPVTSKAIIDWRKQNETLNFGLEPQWSDLIEVKGIGAKTIDKIKNFVESDDPFGVYKTKRMLDTVRKAISAGELPGVPVPTHISIDVPPERELVSFVGVVRAKKYYDAATQLQKRTTEDLSYTEALELLKDSHLLKYVALEVEDEYNEPVRVSINRWRYPNYARDISSIKIDKDVVAVEGFSSDFGGVSINAKNLVVIEP